MRSTRSAFGLRKPFSLLELSSGLSDNLFQKREAQMAHPSPNVKVFSSLTCVIALCCLVRFAASATTVQGQNAMEHIPTVDNPKITVVGFTNTSITEGSTSEVSVLTDHLANVGVSTSPEKDK